MSKVKLFHQWGPGCSKNGETWIRMSATSIANNSCLVNIRSDGWKFDTDYFEDQDVNDNKLQKEKYSKANFRISFYENRSFLGSSEEFQVLAGNCGSIGEEFEDDCVIKDATFGRYNLSSSIHVMKNDTENCFEECENLDGICLVAIDSGEEKCLILESDDENEPDHFCIKNGTKLYRNPLCKNLDTCPRFKTSFDQPCVLQNYEFGHFCGGEERTMISNKTECIQSCFKDPECAFLSWNKELQECKILSENCEPLFCQKNKTEIIQKSCIFESEVCKKHTKNIEIGTLKGFRLGKNAAARKNGSENCQETCFRLSDCYHFSESENECWISTEKAPYFCQNENFTSKKFGTPKCCQNCQKSNGRYENLTIEDPVLTKKSANFVDCWSKYCKNCTFFTWLKDKTCLISNSMKQKFCFNQNATTFPAFGCHEEILKQENECSKIENSEKIQPEIPGFVYKCFQISEENCTFFRKPIVTFKWSTFLANEPIFMGMFAIAILIIFLFAIPLAWSFVFKKAKKMDEKEKEEFLDIFGQFRVAKSELLSLALSDLVPKREEFALLVKEDLENHVMKFTSDYAQGFPLLNRYNTIFPYDHNRVCLEKEINGVDYINASWIKGKKEIATQGPLQVTTPHFLQMILEREADVIVMLSNTTENGKDGKIIPKCCQYWPQFVNTSLAFDHMKITNLGETEMIPLELIKRKLRITNLDTGYEIEVIMLQYIAWPDFGVPNDAMTLIEMLLELKKMNYARAVVHCSAGVGRTGTFLALLRLIDQIHTRQKYLNVFQTVFELRQDRKLMVMKPEQYKFIYTCLATYIQMQD